MAECIKDFGAGIDKRAFVTQALRIASGLVFNTRACATEDRQELVCVLRRLLVWATRAIRSSTPRQSLDVYAVLARAFQASSIMKVVADSKVFMHNLLWQDGYSRDVHTHWSYHVLLQSLSLNMRSNDIVVSHLTRIALNDNTCSSAAKMEQFVDAIVLSPSNTQSALRIVQLLSAIDQAGNNDVLCARLLHNHATRHPDGSQSAFFASLYDTTPAAARFLRGDALWEFIRMSLCHREANISRLCKQTWMAMDTVLRKVAAQHPGVIRFVPHSCLDYSAVCDALAADPIQVLNGDVPAFINRLSSGKRHAMLALALVGVSDASVMPECRFVHRFATLYRAAAVNPAIRAHVCRMAIRTVTHMPINVLHFSEYIRHAEADGCHLTEAYLLSAISSCHTRSHSARHLSDICDTFNAGMTKLVLLAMIECYGSQCHPNRKYSGWLDHWPHAQMLQDTEVFKTIAQNFCCWGDRDSNLIMQSEFRWSRMGFAFSNEPTPRLRARNANASEHVRAAVVYAHMTAMKGHSMMHMSSCVASTHFYAHLDSTLAFRFPRHPIVMAASRTHRDTLRTMSLCLLRRKSSLCTRDSACAWPFVCTDVVIHILEFIEFE